MELFADNKLKTGVNELLTEEELKNIDEEFKSIVDGAKELYEDIVALRAKLKKEEKDVEKKEE